MTCHIKWQLIIRLCYTAPWKKSRSTCPTYQHTQFTPLYSFLGWPAAILWYGFWLAGICYQSIRSHEKCTFISTGALFWYWLNQVSVWICNHILSNEWDEITILSLNANGGQNLVMDNLSYATLYVTRKYLSMLGIKIIHVSKRAPEISIIRFVSNVDLFTIRLSGEQT